MPNVDNFTPVETKTISGSTTSAGATFTAATSVNAPSIMVSNETTTTAYVRWGTGSQTAVVTDTPVLAGVQLVLTKNIADSAAVILKAGTGTVYLTTGWGG